MMDFDATGHFAPTYASWLYNINVRLEGYCGLTLDDLPEVVPALGTWFTFGASAFLVSFCLAAFIEGE